MPTRNSRKQYVDNAYYHVYSRGVDKQVIFHDEQDYAVLLSYLKRYLSPHPSPQPQRRIVESFYDRISLLCYCLMPNHVHFLFRQYDDPRALSDLLQRVFTTYSMYYNQKYERVGPLFQSRYLASHVDNDPYLYHITRYIHRNPNNWLTFPYSSIKYYTESADSDWVNTTDILGLFGNDINKYVAFLNEGSSDDDELFDYLGDDE